jgi:hypothetical protein
LLNKGSLVARQISGMGASHLTVLIHSVSLVVMKAGKWEGNLPTVSSFVLRAIPVWWNGREKPINEETPDET